MGVSIGTQRNRGRSLKGKRAIAVSPLSKAPNMRICMAINKEHGVIRYSMQDHAYDGDSFTKFIKELIKKCKKLKMDEVCFILDNCKIHKANNNNIVKLCQKFDIEVKFLPPYSPELNPIENAFSIYKSKIKSQLRTKYLKELLSTNKAKRGEKTRKRQKILFKACKEASSVIDSELVTRLYSHTVAVFPLVFHNEDL